MTKYADATCTASGIVKIAGVTVPDAIVLSEGTKASTGVAFFDNGKVYYVTSSAQDVKQLITDLVAIVEKIITIATGVDAASNSPGGQTANITALTTLKTSLNASKGTLK